jgi:hypothetical protein
MLVRAPQWLLPLLVLPVLRQRERQRRERRALRAPRQLAPARGLARGLLARGLLQERQQERRQERQSIYRLLNMPWPQWQSSAPSSLLRISSLRYEATYARPPFVLFSNLLNRHDPDSVFSISVSNMRKMELNVLKRTRLPDERILGTIPIICQA